MTVPPGATSPGPFVVSDRALFPRVHPSRDTAVLFGVLSVVGCGPFAGVPAIILGRLVAREISEAPGLYTGAAAARVASAFGWIGSLGFVAIVAGVVASSEPSAGRVLLGAGVALAVLPAVAALFPRLRQRGMVLVQVALGAGLLIAGSALGLESGALRRDAERRIAAETCRHHIDSARRATNANSFADARLNLPMAGNACDDESRAAISAALAALEEREAEHERDEKERRLREAEQRELDAAERFSRQTALIQQRVAAARSLANRGKWEEASQTLAAARSLLASFTETRVAETSEWRVLSEKTEAERPRIEKALQALREHRERQEEAQRQREEARKRAAEAARTTPRRASSGATTVLCCDGTRSPTCGCGRSSFRGCCSHHGGICGGCD